jgi:hypothetical protein
MVRGDDWRMAAAAIISVLILAVIWRQSSRPGVGRGSPPGRALARILLVVAVIVLIGFVNLPVAGDLVTGFLGGIKTAASGFADFLSHF